MYSDIHFSADACAFQFNNGRLRKWHGNWTLVTAVRRTRVGSSTTP